MLDEPMAGVNPALTQSLLGPHQGPARGRHDRAVRRARHGHGPRHLRLGGRDGAGQGHRRRATATTVMADQRVIDAYLGAHHDAPLERRRRKRRSARRGATAVEPSRRGTTRSMTDLRADRRQRSAHEHRRTRRRRGPLGTPRGRRRRAAARRRPGRRLPARASTSSTAATSTASDGRAGRHHRPERRRQVDAAQGDVRPGQGPHAARDARAARTSPASRPNQLVTKGVGFVPQTNNVFPSR